MKRTEEDVCYQAMRSRDRRFDGRFFTAVKTTGIYCRPICPARTPRRENVTFLPTAAAAEALGYRACKRCRPDACPGTDEWLMQSAVVSRALCCIHDGALDEGSVAELSSRVGVGPRHLNRLFHEQLGASPAAIARTRRAHFARRLLDQTDLSVTRVAFGAGFSSIRRFNTVMRESYGRTPTELRKAGRRSPRQNRDRSVLRLCLPYRPPLHWEGLLGFLRPRCIPGVESLQGDVYRRVVETPEGADCIEVRPHPERHHVELLAPTALSPDLQQIVGRTERLFDLAADSRVIDEALGRDPWLLSRMVSGIRVPGCWDGFELTVRAILGQQVTVAGATTLAGRLVEQHGRRVLEREDGLHSLFPEAATLADASLQDLGIPRQRAVAIQTFARAVADGDLDLSPSADPDATQEALRGLPGIGPWTAAYVAMRSLLHPDVFLPGDLGLRKAASGDGRLCTPERLLRQAESWRPWRSYAAMTLWETLRDQGGSE